MIDGILPTTQPLNVESRLTGEEPEHSENDKSIDSKSHGQPIYHRAVSTPPEFEESENLRLLMEPLPGQKAFQTMQPPFKAEDITVDDPEFKHPPFKLNKLSLAIKIFCKSFWGSFQINNPETDRSARVETIRSRVFAVTFTLLSAISGVIISIIGIGSYVVAVIPLASLPDGEIALFVFPFLIAFLSVSAFFYACIFSAAISCVVTSIVSASVDTREKLTEITTLTSPEERFLKKYQRMEESLFALQTRFYAAELDRIDLKIRDCELSEKLMLLTEERAKLKAARIKAGIPDPFQAKWYDAYQHCLRNCYENNKNLQAAISKTEAWLNRAAKQKALLSNEHMLQELNKKVAPKKSIAEGEEKDENPANRVRV